MCVFRDVKWIIFFPSTSSPKKLSIRERDLVGRCDPVALRRQREVNGSGAAARRTRQIKTISPGGSEQQLTLISRSHSDQLGAFGNADAAKTTCFNSKPASEWG